MTSNNNNPGFIPQNLNSKPTAIVAYYNAETDQNLTAEEWQALNSTSSSQVQVVNRGESYRSWKADADEPAYGPCSGCGRDKINFKLTITLKNRVGSWKRKTVFDVDDAVSEAADIIASEGFWEGDLGSGAFGTSIRKNLAAKINEKVKEHTKDDGQIVIANVVNDTNADD